MKVTIEIPQDYNPEEDEDRNKLIDDFMEMVDDDVREGGLDA